MLLEYATLTTNNAYTIHQLADSTIDQHSSIHP
jgi:hypothetical protein